MTQKELLYLEDAIGHEKSIISICNNALNNLSDKNLISFIKSEVKKHTNTKEKLMKVLEDKSND